MTTKIKSLQTAKETLVLVIQELDSMGHDGQVRYVVDRVLNHGDSFQVAMERWIEGDNNGAWN
jgi:polyphosphate kinase 2 (PPK2 family)